MILFCSILTMSFWCCYFPTLELSFSGFCFLLSLFLVCFNRNQNIYHSREDSNPIYFLFSSTPQDLCFIFLSIKNRYWRKRRRESWTTWLTYRLGWREAFLICSSSINYYKLSSYVGILIMVALWSLMVVDFLDLNLAQNFLFHRWVWVLRSRIWDL